MIIRVKFGKEGALRFIGHLDVLRTFQKIFRRAGIPMVYSQGFSPHPIMSFALPLGLGLSSEGEYLDAEIEEMERGEIMGRLQAATSPDLPVYSIRILPDKAGNAMASVGRASYRLAIDPAWAPELQKAAEALMARDTILIQKETKSKTVEMDLRPCLHHLSVSEICPPPDAGEGVGLVPTGGGDLHSALIMTLSAGSKANIKPELVWDLLTEGRKEQKPLAIRRLDLMTEEGISLGTIGEDISWIN